MKDGGREDGVDALTVEDTIIVAVAAQGEAHLPVSVILGSGAGRGARDREAGEGLGRRVGVLGQGMKDFDLCLAWVDYRRSQCARGECQTVRCADRLEVRVSNSHVYRPVIAAGHPDTESRDRRREAEADGPALRGQVSGVHADEEPESARGDRLGEPGELPEATRE